MLLLVALVGVGDFRDERVVGVGVREQRADGEEDLRDGESGRPLVLEDVEADGPITIDVHVVHLGGEGDLGRLEGVVGREVDVEKEDSLVVGRVLGSHDRRLPVELVRIVGGAGRAVGRRVSSEVN